MTSNFDHNKEYIKESIPELMSYILSDEMFWPLHSSKGFRFERMTLGNILLYRAKLKALAKGSGEKAEIEGLNSQIDEFKSQWRSNWGKKCAQEFSVRLRLWTNHIQELTSKKEEYKPDYKFEVRHRVILEFLKEETEKISGKDMALVRALDIKIKSISKEGEFIWKNQFARVFPPDPFWYLYRTLS
ncbi:MAG: hypothetical protein JEZ06_16645 [Anaerolineaceae bacterium]|nr:hypothetical protein [Anaerolineaceae bacterium]